MKATHGAFLKKQKKKIINSLWKEASEVLPVLSLLFFVLMTK